MTPPVERDRLARLAPTAAEGRQTGEAAAGERDGEQAGEGDGEGRTLAQGERLAEHEGRKEQQEERCQGAGQGGDRRRNTVLLAVVERQVVARHGEESGHRQPERIAPQKLEALAATEEEAVEEADGGERRETRRRESDPIELRRRMLAAEQIGSRDETVAQDQEEPDGDREIGPAACPAAAQYPSPSAAAWALPRCRRKRTK